MSLKETLFKPKYKLVFLRKEFDTFNVVKVKVCSKLENTYRMGKKRYIIDTAHPAYIKTNEKYYFMDIESGAQYHLLENQALMNPDELDMIVGNKIIRELTSGVMDNKKEKIVLIILGVLLGGFLATSIVLGIMNKKIQDIYTSFQDTNVPVIPVITNILKFAWRA